MADEHEHTHISGWIPETDRQVLAMVGKLGEEVSETASRLFRIVVQGMDEMDPKSNLPNRVELRRELTDVEACVARIREGMDNLDRLHARFADKLEGYREWSEIIRTETSEVTETGV